MQFVDEFRAPALAGKLITHLQQLMQKFDEAEFCQGYALTLRIFPCGRCALAFYYTVAGLSRKGGAR